MIQFHMYNKYDEYDSPDELVSVEYDDLYYADYDDSTYDLSHAAMPCDRFVNHYVTRNDLITVADSRYEQLTIDRPLLETLQNNDAAALPV